MARFLVSGGGGFIGCNLVRALLARREEVRVLDDFSTGRRSNLEGLSGALTVFEGSILDMDLLSEAMDGVDYCLHQAALPSVPRSIAKPIETQRVNVEGSLCVFLAARNAGVRRLVYASSSSVYGNAKIQPLHESLPRAPMSPYGAGKASVELYAEAFAQVYGMELVGLRYFNVFGPWQNPKSAYAAVIPAFIQRLEAGKPPLVHGDGRQSRDFTYVANVVAANLLACEAKGPLGGIYNIAGGRSYSLLDVLAALRELIGGAAEPVFWEARPGDIRDSLADISRACEALGYKPSVDLHAGLRETVAHFRDKELAA